MASTFSVTVLAALSVLNLVLVLRLLRRVNATSARPERPAGAPPLPLPGTRVGEFAARATDREPVTTAGLSGYTLVGFFTTGCAPCEQFAPAFAQRAAGFPGGRRRVLVVIAGGPGDPAPLADRMALVARVILEPGGGPVSTAFGVKAFPAACVVDDATVVAADFDLASLPLESAQGFGGQEPGGAQRRVQAGHRTDSARRHQPGPHRGRGDQGLPVSLVRDGVRDGGAEQHAQHATGGPE